MTPEAPIVVAVDGLATKHRFDDEGEGVSMSGLRMRKRLLAAVRCRQAAGVKFQMWTLTYDPWVYVQGGKPAEYDSWAEAAYGPRQDFSALQLFWASEAWQRACKRIYGEGKLERHVAECMRKLREAIGDFEWVVVMEFHRSGMVHFHALIFQQGKAFIPFVLMQKCWGMGGVQFSGEKRGQEHASRYATKYLVKGVRVSAWMPDWWVPRYMRFLSTCRGFWGPPANEAKRGNESAHRRGTDVTLGEVRRSPGRWRKMMLRAILETGEIVYRHVKIEMPQCVELLNVLGLLGGGEVGGSESPGRVSFRGRCTLDEFENLASLDYLAHCGATDAGG